jgi:hypothetical protein
MDVIITRARLPIMTFGATGEVGIGFVVDIGAMIRSRPNDT